MDEAILELPRWQCHKVVGAAKIVNMMCELRESFDQDARAGTKTVVVSLTLDTGHVDPRFSARGIPATTSCATMTTTSRGARPRHSWKATRGADHGTPL
jgi:hypothetical protein